MFIPENLADLPYALTPVAQFERTLPDGTPFTAHLVHTSDGFPVWWVTKVLQHNGLTPGTQAHLAAFTDAPALSLPLVALGSPRVRPFIDDWDIEEYPARLPDGRESTVAVDYKDYNKNDYRWIDGAVILLAVAVPVTRNAPGSR